MKTVKIELTKEQEELISQFGNVICSNGKTYTFMPFWFEKDDEETTYEIHQLGSLPKELVRLIKSFREPVNTEGGIEEIEWTIDNEGNKWWNFKPKEEL